MAGLKQIMEIFMAINQPLSSEQRVRWYLQRKDLKNSDFRKSNDANNSLDFCP